MGRKMFGSFSHALFQFTKQSFRPPIRIQVCSIEVKIHTLKKFLYANEKDRFVK